MLIVILHQAWDFRNDYLLLLSLCFQKWIKLDEVLIGFCPNITQKELRVLKRILWTVHDIGDGLHEEVVIRISKNEKDSFQTEKEIEDMICVKKKSFKKISDLQNMVVVLTES